MREFLKRGSRLTLGGTDYITDGVMGSGSNAVVYGAYYYDNINPEYRHKALLKELFPYDKDDRIRRGADGGVECADDARDYFELHMRSFLHGNDAHLNIMSENANEVSLNLNTYRANGTYYTIMAYSEGCTLDKLDISEWSLRERIILIQKIIDAAEIFHKSGLLHLDISPDNIFILTHPENKTVDSMRVALIDYNSAFSGEELADPATDICYSVKGAYTAPEIRVKERESVTAASDMFSLTAIAYEIVTGSSLSWDEVRGAMRGEPLKRLTEASAGLSAAVTKQLIYVIRRGLKLPPQFRYQNARQLRQGLDELLERIDCRGVSHGALWEASRAEYKRSAFFAPPARKLRLVIEAEDGGEGYEYPTSYLKLAEDAALRNEDRMLVGGIGSGKTTLLRGIWGELCADYSSDSPICMYITLSEYIPAADGDFIINHIAETLNRAAVNKTASDGGTKESLRGIIASGKIRLLILLDSLNEAYGDISPLIKEIKLLGSYKGVSLIVSDSVDNRARSSLTAFRLYRILPPDDESIEEFLGDGAKQLPGDGTKQFPRDGLGDKAINAGAVIKALDADVRNPLLLTLYAKTLSSAAVKPELITADLIIGEYLDALKENRIGLFDANETEKLRTEYIFDYTLPAIALEMKRKKRAKLKSDEMLAVLTADYKRMLSRGFNKVCPDFTGKSRQILQGISNGAEWSDYAVNGILCRELGLIYIDGSFDYAAVNEKIISRLSDTAAKTARKLRVRHLSVVVPILAVFILTAAAVGGLIYTKSPFPGGGEETRVFDEAFTALQREYGKYLMLMLYESRLTDDKYTDGAINGDETAYLSILENAERADNIIDRYERTREPEHYYAYLPVGRVPFTSTEYAELFNMFYSTIDYNKNAIERYTDIMNPASDYSQSYKYEAKNALKGYNEASNNYCYLMLRLIICGIKSDKLNDALSLLGEQEMFSRAIIATGGITDNRSELALKVKSARGTLEAAELNMLKFNFVKQ